MTTPTEIAIYHNRMMPFYWMVAVAVTVMMSGVVFFNWNIAVQVRELRDKVESRQVSPDTRSIDQRVHDIAVKLGEQRRKNAISRGEEE